MSHPFTKPAATLPVFRRNFHLHLQLLILPAIILSLLLVLLLQGCAAASGGCSPEEKKNCICRQPGVISFAVDGLSCPNCAKEVQEVIAAVPGVTAAKVCFEDKKAFVTLDKEHPATMEAIKAAIAKRQAEHDKLESDPNCLKPKG